MPDMPLIDAEKCDGCGLCVSVCGCRIISLVNGRAVVTPRKHCSGCRHWCTLCEGICPKEAISCAIEIVIEPKTDSK